MTDAGPIPLYASEERIAIEVFGPNAINDWLALVSTYEGKGLPGINPLTGRRYWPSVKAWLDLNEGLRGAAPSIIPDGREKCLDRRLQRPASSGATAKADISRIGSRAKTS